MISTTYFLAFLLAFLRMFGFFTVLPVFFPKGLPNIAKIALTAIMGYMLLPGIDYSFLTSINSTNTLIFYCINEVITGLVLGYIANLCFNSVKMAGQLIDFQIGFSMINMFDPSSGSNTTLVENLLYWLSLMLFFIIDGHHMLIRALMESFNVVGLGKFILNQKSIMLIIKAFIEFFAIGLKIAIPVILVIIITDIVLGLIGRSVPSLNIMILGLPVKILVGLAGFLFALPYIVKVIVTTFDGTGDLFKSLFKVLTVVFIFASEDKTEEATPKKKSEARKKGQVARSKEVNLALTLLATTLILITLGGYVGNSFKATIITFLSNYLNIDLNYNTLRNITFIAMWRVFLVFLPVALPIMIMGILANYIQVGFMFIGEPLKPQLSKLNPLKGLKRMFSMRTLVETIKNIIIVILLCYVGYSFVRDNFSYILTIGNLKVGEIPVSFGKIVINIFFKVTLIMIIIALIDYIYQRYTYNKELKMTKQEVKEEFKQQEGDPQIKSKIKQRQREMASRRMMQAVPSATVVVTNPTHIAIALKYDEGKSEAPILVAKGADAVAIRIKEIAKENDVPIIENRPLARLIYEKVELDSEIPNDMYQAVAEILALVYKMKKRK
ncbi:fused FliR family export protein/FlhB family type III secretion system protein [Clostridium omnivorum]|uniref:Flagellar biosynthetic protein FliR n=1 Tax=Clostridium omnivorum TaxID=1604902 RepID=A0ABQ5NAY2_9CLOT|nr:fused FliR family export protein/FlhB family type III secretion system protein [Clostridium sp. E14]GLC32363.1 flagellar biosynthetic protein FliR [Clostridium sp. E14]